MPHRLVARQIVLRVIDHGMRIFEDDQLVVTYDILSNKGNLVQDKRFYKALKADREMNRRKYGNGRRKKGRACQTISLLKPPYDVDVQVRSLAFYDRFAEEVRA